VAGIVGVWILIAAVLIVLALAHHHHSVGRLVLACLLELFVAGASGRLLGVTRYRARDVVAKVG
jgi:hypothetical protein